MLARFTLRVVPPPRLLLAAGRIPATLVPRDQDGSLFVRELISLCGSDCEIDLE